jgi:hypothetical protein
VQNWKDSDFDQIFGETGSMEEAYLADAESEQRDSEHTVTRKQAEQKCAHIFVAQNEDQVKLRDPIFCAVKR